MTYWRKIARSITPPIVTEQVNKYRSQPEYSGDFSSFQEARKISTGYDVPAIFEKIKTARQKVLSGEAKYERDGVVFDEPQYFWPVLTSLLYSASKEKNALRLLDYGGSLGTSYFQNLPFLRHLSELRWIIIEQKQFVEFGREKLQNTRLKFYEDAEQAFAKEKIDTVLFSGALQYLDNPYEVLDKLRRAGVKIFIFDRTTFIAGPNDRIVVQRTADKVFKQTTLPAWLFAKDKMKSFFNNEYELLAEFASIGNPITVENSSGECLGMLFEKRG